MITLAQAVRKKAASFNFGEQILLRLQESALILLNALALFFLVALVTYDPADPAWSHTGQRFMVTNAGGVVGAWLADVLVYSFGVLAYIFPVTISYIAWLVYRAERDAQLDYFHLSVRIIGFLMMIGAGCGLAWMHMNGELAAGGFVGHLVGKFAVVVLNRLGTSVVLMSVFLSGITLLTGMSWLWLMDQTGKYTLLTMNYCKNALLQLADSFAVVPQEDEEPADAVIIVEPRKKTPKPRPRVETPVISALPVKVLEETERPELRFEAPAVSELPALDLLDRVPPATGGYSEDVLTEMSRQVETKLNDFGVVAEVVAVQPGPVITRFELQPAPGVKASRITNLAKDLARSLSIVSVRVVEVIPGKSVIGLEIPNQQRNLVGLRDILDSDEYKKLKSPLTLALGADISGHPVVADLARMPHLLVAGTTGAGKSVALNAMILSMLYKSTASQVRMIMIDPKMLELSVYEGIPHLLAPVVTDMNEAANALRWGVAEMERRYRLMAALGVRNIGGFNRKVQDAQEGGEPLLDPFFAEPNAEVPELAELPTIVVIVDELADMMMTVGKKVEELIARLAQKARAAGIHLVLATQRPSVDVITGLIKANIPCRIAFQVSSRVDSRTILDQMGAENLLGHGDMLYLPPGTSLPVRVHGAFVSDHEVHKVVDSLRRAGAPEYVDEILNGPPPEQADAIPGLDLVDSDMDSLYDSAVRIVTETRRASISGIQRRLKIGYNRAARMMEEMESQGVVGQLQSNGCREVLAPPPPKD